MTDQVSDEIKAANKQSGEKAEELLGTDPLPDKIKQDIEDAKRKESVENIETHAVSTAEDDAELKKMLGELTDEFGDEDQVPYNDDDVQGGFVSKDGKYRCFVKEYKVRGNVRKKATDTKPVGSKFFFGKPVLKVIGMIDSDEKVAGNLYGDVYYESGNMANFDKYCLATKCQAFNDGKGNRKYFPQAAHEKGGSVGKPVIVEVEMKIENKIVKSEITGKWIDAVDEHGNNKKVNRANIINWYPWDTDERYEPEEEKEPDLADELGEDIDDIAETF